MNEVILSRLGHHWQQWPQTEGDYISKWVDERTNCKKSYISVLLRNIVESPT